MADTMISEEQLRSVLELAQEYERLRKALRLIADMPFTAAMDAKLMRNIAREALKEGAVT